MNRQVATERESAFQSFPSIIYRPCRVDRSLLAAISNIRTNIPRGPMPVRTRSEPVPGWCRCYDDGTRISFCAPATFVFTTPLITLTRNERGMRADAPSGRRRGGATPPPGLAAKFYSTFRERPPRGRDSSGNDFKRRLSVFCGKATRREFRAHSRYAPRMLNRNLRARRRRAACHPQRA